MKFTVMIEVDGYSNLAINEVIEELNARQLRVMEGSDPKVTITKVKITGEEIDYKDIKIV